MSECLHENIDRLKENSLLKARMYGEYECAILLQHFMLQKKIDECKTDALAIQATTFFSDRPRGFLVDFPHTDRPELFHIHIAEAQEAGFEGMYHLLSQYKYWKESPARLSLSLHREQGTLEFRGAKEEKTGRLLLWSLAEGRWLPLTSSRLLTQPGDFFFLCNGGCTRFYPNPTKLQDLLAKVLKVFAIEGLSTVSAMIQKELSFALKRKPLSEDIHLLSCQVLFRK
jgi:hypothetical protein